MKPTTALALLLVPAPGIAQESATVSHRVLGADRGRVAIVAADGKVEWEVPCKFQVHDLQRLPNGNILFHTSNTRVVEMTPAREVAWSYESRPKAGYDGPVEIHAIQRLDEGRTLIAESGNRRLIEVDKAGQIVKEIPLTVENPHPHRDTRLARKLKNGHYLVCHESDGKVREYDGEGKVVWTYALDLAGRPRTGGHDGHGTEVFGALRLDNGNTLIACGNGNRVIEVNPEGKTVWSIEHDELPGIRLFWVTGLKVLPNGNIVFGNCHAGPNNPQLIEVTRDKKVAWTFRNHEVFGNDLAAATVLD
ncbi:MAG: PQQ-binding-like beta-propeller repeat protein [Isosphaeraceae bacterium]